MVPDFQFRGAVLLAAAALVVGTIVRLATGTVAQDATVLAAFAVGLGVRSARVVVRGDRIVFGYSRGSILGLAAAMVATGVFDRPFMWTALLGGAAGLICGGLWRMQRIVRSARSVEAR